jgi:hypothetical protein
VEGLAQVNEGIEQYQNLPTPPVFWPMLLAVQAATHALAGRVADGLTLIDEALAIAEHGLDRGPISDLSLLKGDRLTLAATGADPEPWFRRAFDMAEELEARMPQLPAAIRLCRLWRDQGRAEEADGVLRPSTTPSPRALSAPT